MSKMLNKPEHYAENGSLIQDQWYLHSIRVNLAGGQIDNPIEIFMINKSNTPVTLSNIHQQLRNTIWRGVAYNAVDYEVTNAGVVLGVGEYYNDSNNNYVKRAMIAYSSRVSSSSSIPCDIIANIITSVSDTVTPY